MARLRAWLALACVSALLSCESPSGGPPPCEPGTERCECKSNGRCNGGLSCASNTCVYLPGSTSSGPRPVLVKAGSGGTSTAPAGAASAGRGGAGGSTGSGAAKPMSASGLSAAGARATTTSCVAANGGDCSGKACCGGVPCVANVCMSDCVSNDGCESDCCYSLDSGKKVCAAPILCEPPPGGSVPGAGPGTGSLTPITTCTKLSLVGDDGQFLGVASSNTFATDGVCNEFSQYGNEFGSNSIHNEFGQYGGEFSSKSAYNQFTSTPPRLRCESGAQLNPVTKNKFLADAIDPDVLCPTLAANGF